MWYDMMFTMLTSAEELVSEAIRSRFLAIMTVELLRLRLSPINAYCLMQRSAMVSIHINF